MGRHATDQGVTFTCTEIDALLSPAEQYDVLESVPFKEPGRYAVGVTAVILEKSDEDASLETDGLYSVKNELRSLAMVNAELARFSLLNVDMLTKLSWFPT